MTVGLYRCGRARLSKKPMLLLLTHQQVATRLLLIAEKARIFIIFCLASCKCDFFYRISNICKHFVQQFALFGLRVCLASFHLFLPFRLPFTLFVLSSSIYFYSRIYSSCMLSLCFVFPLFISLSFLCLSLLSFFLLFFYLLLRSNHFLSISVYLLQMNLCFWFIEWIFFYH